MRYRHLLSEQQLDEIRMSPSALRQFAASPEAEGIQAGFEAELVFPGLADEEGGDSEPDYDYDERAYSIEDIINFFEYDDYGYGLSGREADRLRNELDDAWMEYFDEAMYEGWYGEQQDRVRDYIVENDWNQEDAIREYLEGEGVQDDKIDYIIAVGEGSIEKPEDGESEEFQNWRDAKQLYREADFAADQQLDAKVEESIANQDGNYDSALDEFRDNFNDVSQEDWLRENYRYMSDVESAFGLTWPYIRYEGSEGGFNEYQAEQLASDLEKAIGMRVVASGGYHSTSRKPGLWIIESDSSLDGDDSDDMPAEIVSPPMPLNQCLEMLEKFWAWAGTHNAYTNNTTGFHMGVSLPRVGGNVDFIKLALFLGDEHVLKEFGRMSNTYAEAAMKKIRSRIKGNPDQINDAMKLMQHGLIELAERSMSRMGGGKEKGFGKYTSINPKGKYIEFRSAGGEDYNKDIKKLQNTLMRYAQAMSIAADPSAERKEYYKKLYKLISPEGKNPAMELFAKFASGNISKEELKKEWAEAALQKDAPQELDKSSWKIYDKATGKPLSGYQYNGYTKQEALALAKQAMSPGSTMFGFKQAFDEKYELRNVSKSTGRWAIIDSDTHQTWEVIDAPTRGEVADIAREKYGASGESYYIEPVPSDTPAEPLSRRAELAKRIKQGKDKPKQQEPAVEPQETPPATTPVERRPEQATASNGIPMWEIYNRRTGETITRFPDHNQTAAWSTAQQWLTDQGVERQAWDNYSVRAASETTPAAQPTAQEPANQQPNYEIYKERTGQVMHQFHATSPGDAQMKAEQWMAANGMQLQAGHIDMRPIAQQPVAGSTQAIQQQRAAGEFTGAWKIVNSNTGEELHRFSGVGNVQADANRVAGQWIRSARIDDPVEVVPVMAESNKLAKNMLSELHSWLDTIKLPKGLK